MGITNKPHHNAPIEPLNCNKMTGEQSDENWRTTRKWKALEKRHNFCTINLRPTRYINPTPCAVVRSAMRPCRAWGPKQKLTIIKCKYRNSAASVLIQSLSASKRSNEGVIFVTTTTRRTAGRSQSAASAIYQNSLVVAAGMLSRPKKRKRSPQEIAATTTSACTLYTHNLASWKEHVLGGVKFANQTRKANLSGRTTGLLKYARLITIPGLCIAWLVGSVVAMP